LGRSRSRPNTAVGDLNVGADSPTFRLRHSVKNFLALRAPGSPLHASDRPATPPPRLRMGERPLFPPTACAPRPGLRSSDPTKNSLINPSTNFLGTRPRHRTVGGRGSRSGRRSELEDDQTSDRPNNINSPPKTRAVIVNDSRIVMDDISFRYQL
jgi:hypothetical protein